MNASVASTWDQLWHLQVTSQSRLHHCKTPFMPAAADVLASLSMPYIFWALHFETAIKSLLSPVYPIHQRRLPESHAAVHHSVGYRRAQRRRAEQTNPDMGVGWSLRLLSHSRQGQRLVVPLLCYLKLHQLNAALSKASGMPRASTLSRESCLQKLLVVLWLPALLWSWLNRKYYQSLIDNSFACFNIIASILL